MDSECYLLELEKLLTETQYQYNSYCRMYSQDIVVHMHIHLLQLKEKILDVKHAIYKKKNPSKIIQLEKQVEELRQMVLHLPGIGEAYIKAKTEFNDNASINKI